MSTVRTNTKVWLEYQVLDKDGKPKKIWADNPLGEFLRKHRKGRKWPFITGRWTTTMIRRVKWPQ